jgi:hypothetical protein
MRFFSTVALFEALQLKRGLGKPSHLATRLAHANLMRSGIALPSFRCCKVTSIAPTYKAARLSLGQSISCSHTLTAIHHTALTAINRMTLHRTYDTRG